MRALILCGALLAVACGGGMPSGNSNPAAPSPAVAFPDGAYQLGFLKISPAASGSSVCLEVGSPPANSILHVRLTRASEAWRFEMPNTAGPDSGPLSGEIRSAGGGVTVWVRGTAVDGGGRRVTLQGPDGSGDAVLTGRGSGATAYGEVSGQLTFGGSALTGSCVGWVLTPL